jgi:glycosyltransferase 2 family protein
MATTDQQISAAEQRRAGSLRAFEEAETPPVPEVSVEVGAPDRPPDGIGRRLLKPQTLVSFGLAIGIVAFLVTRLDISLSAVWGNVKNANPYLFLLGVSLFYGTFALRAFRWRWMLSQAGIDREHGYDVPKIPQLMEIMLLSWFVNCIMPAKLGDAYRCYLLKRQAHAPFSTTLGTILAERLTDLIVLFMTMSIAGAIAFRGDLPPKVVQTMWIGIVLIAIGLVALGVLAKGRDKILRFIPHRFHAQFDMLQASIFACLRRPLLPIAISVVIWLTDGIRLYAVAASLGAGLSFPLALFVALMSALLTTLPITPAGLGVVEGAIVAVLALVEIDENMGLSVAFMDRLIGYWSIVAVGIILYVRRLKADVLLSEQPVRSADD